MVTYSPIRLETQEPFLSGRLQAEIALEALGATDTNVELQVRIGKRLDSHEEEANDEIQDDFYLYIQGEDTEEAKSDIATSLRVIEENEIFHREKRLEAGWLLEALAEKGELTMFPEAVNETAGNSRQISLAHAYYQQIFGEAEDDLAQAVCSVDSDDSLINSQEDAVNFALGLVDELIHTGKAENMNVAHWASFEIVSAINSRFGARSGSPDAEIYSKILEFWDPILNFMKTAEDYGRRIDSFQLRGDSNPREERYYPKEIEEEGSPLFSGARERLESRKRSLDQPYTYF